MGSAEGGDIFEEEVSDEEVRLELVPGTTQVILANNITDSTLMHILQVNHPLNAINQYLLLYVLIGPFIPFRSLVFRCQMPEL